MTAILGYIDMIDQACGEEGAEATRDVRDYLATVSRNGEHLLQLINDILDLSKIEAHRLEIEQCEIPLTQVVDDIYGLMHGRAVGKGIALDVEYATDMPLTIKSDPTRLRQILVNLVGNAIKFTETGSVRIVISFNGEADAPRLRFDIHDTGIGMSPGALQRLFKPFAQADASMTRRFGGTGLGLTISKRLAEMLGGDITVESRQNEGSCFSVTIGTGPIDPTSLVKRDSVREAAPQPTTPNPQPQDQIRLDGVRVLIVEDGPDNQRLISAVLKRAGATFELADNGKIGVEKAWSAETEQTPFDLILMDMQMPVLDGYAAASRLRDEDYPRPIVALTAHAMEGEREKCLSAGCADYASKPINRQRLLKTVQRLVSADVAPPIDATTAT
jgi:CheY-like chemotaxis protein